MRFEALGRGNAEADWRQVDEEELTAIFGDDEDSRRACMGGDVEEAANEEDVRVAEPEPERSKKVFQSVIQETETCPERSKVSVRQIVPPSR
jgi:hypothetical protein